VAQALRPHFGFVERLLSNRATEAERQTWYPRINAGLVVGNAVTDSVGRAPGSGETAVLADADGVLRLNGVKFYSTGTLFTDVVAVSAVDAAGNDIQVIVPTDRAGVELLDDWDGFGQRTTATGTSRFTDVVVHTGMR
jgi:alkylation response protein AidB-like acyl-CoA dehydrogenase